MLSQAYAKEHQLGIDTTMKVVEELTDPKTGRLVYDITVREYGTEERIFRTTELINDDGTGVLCGRGTRIWHVNEVVDGVEDDERNGVLKDSWIDEDQTREGHILEQIGNLMQVDDKDIFDVTYLTVVCHGDVFIGDTPDNTRSLSTRGVSLPKKFAFDLHCTSLGEALPPVSNTWDIATPERGAVDLHLAHATRTWKKIIEYFPRSHYRIVFRQRCTPLSKLTSLSMIFGHLADVVVGECLSGSDIAWSRTLIIVQLYKFSIRPLHPGCIETLAHQIFWSIPTTTPGSPT